MPSQGLFEYDWKGTFPDYLSQVVIQRLGKRKRSTTIRADFIYIN